MSTYPGFTPDASIGTVFGAVSSNILLPGSSVSTDTLVYVVNMGPLPVAFALGGSTVAATTNGNLIVMPGQSFFFGRGSATYIAGIACGPLTGQFATVNISTGN